MDNLILIVPLALGLLAFGAYQILGTSSLMRPLRTRLPRFPRELVECPLCLGTWVGLVCGPVVLWALDAAPWIIALTTLPLGATSGGLSLLLSSAVDYLEAQSALARAATDTGGSDEPAE